MNKILKNSISVALSFLMLTMPFSVFAETESLNLTPPETTIKLSETVERASLKNKIEENNGIVTINGEEVYYISDSEIKINNNPSNANAKFVKPEELSSDEIVCKLFREGSPRPEEVQQGALGTCTFLAGLSSLSYSDPGFIKENLIEYDNDFVIVKFFNPENGQLLYVMVQKTIPNMENDCAFLSNNCLWVHMYLKACVALRYLCHYLPQGIDFIDYEATIYDTPALMFWFVSTVTGKKLKSENSRSLKEECLYKKVKKTLNSKGIVLCTFGDSKLCKMPFLKYFFKGIEYQGMQANHAYSVLRTCEDKSGIKWVCCRNPWGCFVPDYDKDGKLSVNNGNYTDGYFWLKLKDFYKNCDKIYFSTEKNIANNVMCK